MVRVGAFDVCFSVFQGIIIDKLKNNLIGFTDKRGSKVCNNEDFRWTQTARSAGDVLANWRAAAIGLGRATQNERSARCLAKGA